MPFECAACIEESLLLKRIMPNAMVATSYTLSTGGVPYRIGLVGPQAARKPPVRQNFVPQKAPRKPLK